MNATGRAVAGAIVPLILAVIKAYQRWVSPFFLPRCRFHPSCSAYAVQALTTRGLRSGSWLAVRRIVRCQPFADGGFDPVPVVVGRRTPGENASTASTGAPS